MYAVCKCKWIRHLEYAYFSFFLTHLEIEMMQKMYIRSYIPLVSSKIIPDSREGTWVNFCWVCAAGLSEPLPHYSLLCGQL